VEAALAESGDSEGAVVLADEQTAGRGRLGRSWFSPPLSGLYVSTVLAPARARVDRDRATLLLPLAAGVAIAEAVESITGLRLDLKWPNDLYVGRRKVGGILAEAVATDAVANQLQHVVLGYGLNLTAAAYPAEISGRATSIESELGRPIDRALLLVETLTTIARRYADLVDGRYDAILDAWRLRAPASIGSRVAWTTTSGGRSGMTMGIDDRGALLVKSDGGVERIVAGELTWL